MFGDLQPAVVLEEETGFDQGPEGGFDALGRRAQQLRELFDLDLIPPDVGQDAEQLVEGYGLGPEVRHPADVEPGALSRASLSPGGISRTLSILVCQYSGPGSVSLR